MTANTLTLIGMIVVAIPGIISCIWLIIYQRKQLPGQMRVSNSQADKDQQLALQTAVETSQLSITQSSQTLRENIRLTRENSILTKRMADVEYRLSALELDKADLEDWVKRLCEQVVSLGGIPVSRRKREAQ
jgi:hypothetical protein